MPEEEFDSDLDLVAWLLERLKEYWSDLQTAPEQVGNQYTYIGIFKLTIQGQAKTAHELLQRAKQMVQATPWADNPARANDWLRQELPGWTGVTLWADTLWQALNREKP